MLIYIRPKAACDSAETDCSISANPWLLVIRSLGQVFEQVAVDGSI